MFLVTFVWNLISIPAKQDQKLKDEIKLLQPDFLSLTQYQWLIVRACNLELEEHSLWSNSGIAQIDGADLVDAGGGQYSYGTTNVLFHSK